MIDNKNGRSTNETAHNYLNQFYELNVRLRGIMK